MQDETTLSVTFSKEDIEHFELLIKEGKDPHGTLDHIVTLWKNLTKE
jgi:hypothetical protein